MSSFLTTNETKELQNTAFEQAIIKDISQWILNLKAAVESLQESLINS